jgi:CheY-like chemotaxis protein
MTKPLALVLYESLLPGSQLVNRLQDLNYRVQALADPAVLAQAAEEGKPMLVLVDLASTGADICVAIKQLKTNAATKHVPVIAFSKDNSPKLQTAAREAGVTLLVSETAILNHLAQFLDQALQVE